VEPARLGRENAVYSGSSTNYSTTEVEGWLSIKTVLAGAAVWETPERRFTVDQDSYLILNDRHRYTLRMDSPEGSTTFVLFFRRGLVEDVYRFALTPAARLVVDPEAEAAPVEFYERLEPLAGPVGQLLRRFRRRLERERVSAGESDEWFTRIAEQMVRAHRQADAAAARLPALRPATRQELYRRVSRGRDYLLARPAERVTLQDLAREACLSPYHFHRTFRSAFGCAPHEYLTRQRLERARRLLLETRRSVTDICFDIGFESLGSFSSLFRCRFGLPPSALRGGQNKIRKIEEVSLAASA
jgi:AraC-like DNA-binding protein